MKGLAVRIAVVLVACASVGVLGVPNAAAADIYAFANGCYALRDASTGRFVVKDALGYAATATTARGRDAVPHAGHRPRPLPVLRPGGRMPAPACSTRRPGHHARAGGRLARRRRRRRRCGSPASPTAGASASARSAGSASRPPPRPALDVRSQPAAARRSPRSRSTPPGRRSRAPARRARAGLPRRAHPRQRLPSSSAASFHCGRPWSPYGVTVALQRLPRPRTERRDRDLRELPHHRQPDRHPQHRRLAERSPAGPATTR